MQTHFQLTITKTASLALLLAALSSCNNDPRHPGYEFMPDMYRSPSYEVNSYNENFKNGQVNMQPVKGTVAQNHEVYLYPNTIEGYEAAGAELKNPIEKSEIVLEEGKVLYNDFCSHCHGEKGEGNGTIVDLGKFPPPPSFSNQLKELSDGKMYHSITYGKNLMGPHGLILSPEERWKIIHHLNKLQGK
ncbi:MAG: cytochrome c [Flavobacteriales bacterium]|nr:cytochrome c [Flavobacteriales bacterium]